MKPTRPKTPRKAMAKLKASVKDPIEVYCRIRPLDDENEQLCIKTKDDKTIILYPSDVSQTARILKETHYSFKHVFNEDATQKEVFDYVCLPLVQDLLQGRNGLLFTYGITSSGKTYTMAGTPQDGGLLTRCLDVIFNSVGDVQAKKFVFKPDKLNGFDVQSPAEALQDQQKELGVFKYKPRSKKEVIGDWSTRVPDTSIIDDIIPDVCFSVFISYFEIYNNYIYDLLDDTPIDPKKLKNLNSKMLREDAAHTMYVFNAIVKEVKSAEDALDLFYKGQMRRKVSHTALNTESSRSHSVFTIRVVQGPLDPQGAEVLQEKDNIIISQLSLVDLAGSERPVKTKTTGFKLREAGNINNSLMALRTCIEALRESQIQGTSKMVPYRETKLTHLFKTFFEGEGKIKMIICVNPRADYYDETIHVMRFAEMTQDVMISRPTPVSTPNIPGLTPGRGNMYRKAVQRAREQGVPVSEILPPTIYSLGPDFPSLNMDDFDDESAYINLIDFLEARIVRRNTLAQDLERRQEDFRKNLISIDKENCQLKQDNIMQQMELDHRKQQIRSLEQNQCSMEDNLSIYQKQAEEYKRQFDNASAEISDKNRMLVEKDRLIERMKIENQEKLASEKDRLKRLMERKNAAKQAKLERIVCLKDEKFRQLREILVDDDWDGDGEINIGSSVPSTATSSEASVPVTRNRKKSESAEPSAENRFTKSRSATDFVLSSNGPNVQFSSQSSRNNIESVFSKENRPPTSSQGTRGVAVANPRHRRSTSAGDVWIEHKPIGNLELNTVMQPAMKKKKSVSKLEVKDMVKNVVSKYVLQHQEQDSQGEVETQLYKGDVIPSAGGGAQVIFNDVEKLRQVSPPPVYNLRKRSGDSLPLREVEDREKNSTVSLKLPVHCLCRMSWTSLQNSEEEIILD